MLLVDCREECVLFLLEEFLAVVLADAAESLVAQLADAFVGDVHGFAHFAKGLRGFADGLWTGDRIGTARCGWR